EFLTRSQSGALDLGREARHLARLYDEVAQCIEELAAGAVGDSGSTAFAHADRLFLEKVIGMPVAAHRAHAAALRERAAPEPSSLARDYRRLASLLKVEISSFERKQYENLSHQPNKAMNLNAYIGLIGKSFRIEAGLCCGRLVECAAGEADLSVPAADYLLTLDADSL